MVAEGWDSLRELLSLQERMNDLFEDTRSRTRQAREPLRQTSWTPMVDIFERDGKVYIKADLPEMKQEDIKVSLEDGRLTIQGERKPPGDLKPEQFYRQERMCGSFSRSFSLPEIVDHEQVRADYRDGVLTIVLPRREEVKPRKIAVQVE